jgi:Uma2 family endonuclease
MSASNAGERDDASLEAEDVRLVVEVLSPSMRELDMFAKLDEYKSVASIRHILLVEPNAPRAILWSRDAAQEWMHANLEGWDAAAELPSLGLSIPLREIYAGLAFRLRPNILEGEAG